MPHDEILKKQRNVCVWCVCVKLYCLFHNRRDEIRGQVSDSTTACHKNTHRPRTTLHSMHKLAHAETHTHLKHTHLFSFLTHTVLSLWITTCLTPVLLWHWYFDFQLTKAAVKLSVYYSFQSTSCIWTRCWSLLCSGGLSLSLCLSLPLCVSLQGILICWASGKHTEFKIWLTVGAFKDR